MKNHSYRFVCALWVNVSSSDSIVLYDWMTEDVEKSHVLISGNVQTYVWRVYDGSEN